MSADHLSAPGNSSRGVGESASSLVNQRERIAAAGLAGVPYTRPDFLDRWMKARKKLIRTGQLDTLGRLAPTTRNP